MIPFITCEISLGQYVSELVFGVDVLDLDFWGPSWFNEITNQEQLCGFLKHVSMSGFFPWWLLHCPQNTYNKASWCEDWTFEGVNQHYPNHWSLFEIACVCESCEVENKFHLCSQRVSPVFQESESCFQELKQSHPINQEREYRLTSILHPKRWFLILLNCAKLKFVSYTSNLLEQMYDFQKRTMFHPK